VEGGDFAVFRAAIHFDGLTANFAILDVNLAPDREVQDHRNLLPAVGAIEKMFHVACVPVAPGPQFPPSSKTAVIPNAVRDPSWLPFLTPENPVTQRASK
jgi:hypothetical protein